MKKNIFYFFFLLINMLSLLSPLAHASSQVLNAEDIERERNTNLPAPVRSFSYHVSKKLNKWFTLDPEKRRAMKEQKAHKLELAREVYRPIHQDLYFAYLDGLKKTLTSSQQTKHTTNEVPTYFLFSKLVNDQEKFQSVSSDRSNEPIINTDDSWDKINQDNFLIIAMATLTNDRNLNNLLRFLSQDSSKLMQAKDAIFQKAGDKDLRNYKNFKPKITKDVLSKILQEEFTELFNRSLDKIVQSKDFLVSSQSGREDIHARALQAFDGLLDVLASGKVDKYIALYSKFNQGMLACNDAAMNTVDNMEMEIVIAKSKDHVELMQALLTKYKRSVIDAIVIEYANKNKSEKVRAESLEISLYFKIALNKLLRLGLGTKYLYNNQSAAANAQRLDIAHLMTKLLTESFSVDNFVNYLLLQEEGWGEYLAKNFWEELPESDPLKVQYDEASMNGDLTLYQKLNRPVTIEYLNSTGMTSTKPLGKSLQ